MPRPLLVRIAGRDDAGDVRIAEIEADAVDREVPFACPRRRDPVRPSAQVIANPAIVHPGAGNAERGREADREIARLVRPAIALDDRGREAMPLVARRRARRVVEAGGSPRRLKPVLEGEARQTAEQRVFEDRRAVGLAHHPGGLARGIAFDRCSVRRFRIPVDAGEREGGRVGDRREWRHAPPSPDAPDQHRVIGCCRVQVAPVGEAAFGELARLVDVARHAMLGRELHRHENDPFAGRRPRRRFAHDLDDLRYRGEPSDRDPAAGFQPLAVHVRVGVEDAGRHRAAPGVDDPSLAPAPPQNLRRGADRLDPPVPDRECLRLRPRRIEGEHASIAKDEVGFGHVGSRGRDTAGSADAPAWARAGQGRSFDTRLRRYSG